VKIIFQGFNNDQIFPRKAEVYAIPTHHITHTNVGEILYIGLESPIYPANIIIINKKTLIICIENIILDSIK
jgi:hypothetical protein